MREELSVIATAIQAALRAHGRKTILMTMARHSKAAFTLVELMIVVAVIGLLAGIAVPSIVRARTQSQTNACINNLRQIDDASQEWALDNHQAADATVLFTDIQSYLKRAVICPSAGTGATFADSYILTTVSNKPACNMVPATHVLPPDLGQSPHLSPM
jgi:prepilin-type N-terminal cleavage/methylation domain-containing protein